VLGKGGNRRLQRLRTLIARAQERGKEQEAGLRQAHAWLHQIAQLLDPEDLDHPPDGLNGARVRERVESYLDDIAAIRAKDDYPASFRSAVEHMQSVVIHFRDYLYHCYDIPGLPRTNNDLEQFYRRVKATERRITGHRRSDNFVVRMGGFAAYALATEHFTEADLRASLARVPASDWLHERATLRAIQDRQTRMRRFRLHRDAFLADIEARWAQIHDAGPP
jgi:hypothetical protein